MLFKNWFRQVSIEQSVRNGTNVQASKYSALNTRMSTWHSMMIPATQQNKTLAYTRKILEKNASRSVSSVTAESCHAS